jgi:hypothetical protein
MPQCRQSLLTSTLILRTDVLTDIATILNTYSQLCVENALKKTEECGAYFLIFADTMQKFLSLFRPKTLAVVTSKNCVQPHRFISPYHNPYLWRYLYTNLSSINSETFTTRFPFKREWQPTNVIGVRQRLFSNLESLLSRMWSYKIPRTEVGVMKDEK